MYTPLHLQATDVSISGEMGRISPFLDTILLQFRCQSRKVCLGQMSCIENFGLLLDGLLGLPILSRLRVHPFPDLG